MINVGRLRKNLAYSSVDAGELVPMWFNYFEILVDTRPLETNEKMGMFLIPGCISVDVTKGVEAEEPGVFESQPLCKSLRLHLGFPFDAWVFSRTPLRKVNS